MGQNFLTIISQGLASLYNGQAGYFLSTGLSFFYPIVTLNIFLMGLDAFAGRLFMEAFIKKVGMILVVGSLLAFYNSPLPGTGTSFSHLVTDEAKMLSDRIESTSTTGAMNQLNSSLASIEQPPSGMIPTISDLVSAAWYFLIQFILGGEKVVLIGVLGVAYLAIGVVVLVGPLFIPWLLLPGLEFLAWGWFRAYLQYNFYLVVAAAVTFLNATALLAFFNVHPLPWAIKDLPSFALELMVVIGISIYVVTHVPRIASSIIGGGGESLINTRGI